MGIEVKAEGKHNKGCLALTECSVCSEALCRTVLPTVVSEVLFRSSPHWQRKPTLWRGWVIWPKSHSLSRPEFKISQVPVISVPFTVYLQNSYKWNHSIMYSFSTFWLQRVFKICPHCCINSSLTFVNGFTNFSLVPQSRRWQTAVFTNKILWEHHHTYSVSLRRTYSCFGTVTAMLSNHTNGLWGLQGLKHSLCGTLQRVCGLLP